MLFLLKFDSLYLLIMWHMYGIQYIIIFFAGIEVCKIPFVICYFHFFHFFFFLLVWWGFWQYFSIFVLVVWSHKGKWNLVDSLVDVCLSFIISLYHLKIFSLVFGHICDAKLLHPHDSSGVLVFISSERGEIAFSIML